MAEQQFLVFERFNLERAQFMPDEGVGLQSAPVRSSGVRYQLSYMCRDQVLLAESVEADEGCIITVVVLCRAFSMIRNEWVSGMQ